MLFVVYVVVLWLILFFYCIVVLLFSGRCDVTPLPGERPTISQPWGRECLNIGNVFHRIGHVFLQDFDLIGFVLGPTN